MIARLLKPLPACLLASLLLGACATDLFRNKPGTAAEKLAAATQQLKQNPGDKAAKVDQANERYKRINELFDNADRALENGDHDEARSQYQAVLQLEPDNPRAQASLRQMETNLRHSSQIADAQQLFDGGDVDGARKKLRSVLIENPSQMEARNLMRDIEAKTARDQIIPRKLKPPRGKTVTLEFREANLRNIFEVISKTSGINFVFDPGVSPDLKASVFVKDASVEEAIDFLLLMHQLGKKVLTENSLLIYPGNRAVQYEDLVLRTFYLNHADAKQTASLIKTMMPIKEMYIDDKLNMISLKATYDQLRDVDKLISDMDVPEPEVVLDVEILEVKRSRLTDLGITYPDTIAVLGASDKYLTLNELHNITSSMVAVSPAPALRLLRQDGDTNLLANPRIRVKNREKAKIHIGDKIPIITTTVSSNSNFASKSANYLDVGLKLDVEPRVMLNNDVSIKVSLEVSNATLAAGADFPTVSTRNTSTVMMTADGETQVLAGLISDEDRKNAKKVPGLADLPLLGRLFTEQTDDRSKTELILLITPHVVRNLLRPEAANAEFYTPPGARTGGPANFNPAAILQQFGGVPAPRQQVAPTAPSAPGGNRAPEGQTVPAGGPQQLGSPVGTQ